MTVGSWQLAVEGKCFKLSALSFRLKTIISIKSNRYLSVFRIIGLVPGSLHGYHDDELNAQIIHQVIIIAAQFIFILLFPEIIFDFVFVPLEGGNDIRYFHLVDAERYKKR